MIWPKFAKFLYIANLFQEPLGEWIDNPFYMITASVMKGLIKNNKDSKTDPDDPLQVISKSWEHVLRCTKNEVFH